MTNDAAWLTKPGRYAAATAALAIVYAITAKASLLTAYAHPSVAPIWVPAGIALAVLLMTSRRLWPGIFIGAVVAHFPTAGLASWGALLSRGPFSVIGDVNEGLLLLQLFLATTAATTLAIAAAVDERQRAQRQVAVLNRELEQRVAERTEALGRSELLLTEAQRLRSRAETGEERARFLADASTALAASLDYNAPLNSLASLAVPRIADWCSVQLLKEDGSVSQIALAHVRPEKVTEIQALSDRYPPDPANPQGFEMVIRTGRSQLVPVITDEMLVAGTRSPDQLEFVRSLNLLSYMIVPLSAHGHVLGALTFATTRPGRIYDESDLVLAEELARPLRSRIRRSLRARRRPCACAKTFSRSPRTSCARR